MLKFISYNGMYPNLCSGTLIFELDGQTIELNSRDIMQSRGIVWFDEDWDEHVETNDWIVDKDNLPEELIPYAEEVIYLINTNIPAGCCGGCI